MIRKALNILVVEIPISLEDMIEVLIQVNFKKHNCDRLYLSKWLGLLNPVFNINIKQITAKIQLMIQGKK